MGKYEATVTRRALVTGSARGIWRAIAGALFRDGLEVTGLDILEHDSAGFEKTIQADLSDPAVYPRILEEAGELDVLINNAARFIHKPVSEFTIAELDQTIAVKLRALFFLSQGAVESMTRRGWCRIVNMSSVGARTGGVSDLADYNATKAAIISLTKNFARNYGPHGVTANAVAPGLVDAFMTSHVPDDLWADYISQIPLQRSAQPMDIAEIVAFLVSEAAGYATAATIDVNGGWVMT